MVKALIIDLSLLRYLITEFYIRSPSSRLLCDKINSKMLIIVATCQEMDEVSSYRLNCVMTKLTRVKLWGTIVYYNSITHIVIQNRRGWIVIIGDRWWLTLLSNDSGTVFGIPRRQASSPRLVAAHCEPAITWEALGVAGAWLKDSLQLDDCFF